MATLKKTEVGAAQRWCFVVRELIAKKLKPRAEGEFVKVSLVAAVELLAPDKN